MKFGCDFGSIPNTIRIAAEAAAMKESTKPMIVPNYYLPYIQKISPIGEKSGIAYEQVAARLGLPVEKFKEIQAYTMKLRKKYPHMKPDRIKRKVCEHFKIRLT
ncbi:hypothetical protein [Chitinophaga sp. LS1]|uniref:hypothetical protein n=1 Tax=Chitinophaga sp. LS1 TaxID=3051176 RepID=UPI002AAA6A60|nr:hypothetical protein [Chitinophaga sp. LS1]WPV66290.1 hypothetical protein QQL36_31320 [Chitinophaga sp. LS1]